MNSTPKKERRKWKPAFLKALSISPQVNLAAESAGVHPSMPYKARKSDARFAAAWDAAIETSIELLEASLRKRALGEDTTAAIFLLKAHRPDVYRERSSVDMTSGGKAFKVVGIPIPEANE